MQAVRYLHLTACTCVNLQNEVLRSRAKSAAQRKDESFPRWTGEKKKQEEKQEVTGSLVKEISMDAAAAAGHSEVRNTVIEEERRARGRSSQG